MLRKLFLSLAFAAAAAAGFATWSWSQGAALPWLALPAFPAAMDPAIRGDDSVAVASFAQNRCRLLWREHRKACYEDLLLQLVQKDRVRLSMGALNLLGQHSAAIRRIGHDYSHVIGINAWAPGKDLATVYLQCTELFQSGCYHGVVQAYFAYEGTDSAKVTQLCRDKPGISNSGWLRFQCVHGIGHGLVQTYTMDLPRALSGCDMLGNAWDSESCYGGAFMEFIVGGRGQSHHPHLALPNDSLGSVGMASSSMDHAAMAPSPPFKARNPDDLLYPCSVLGPKYQRACYQMQAGLIVERTGLDFAKVAAVCETAPEAMRATCYQGIGTYVSGVTTRNPSESIRLCSMGSTRYRPWCFIGVVKNFVDVTANPDDGIAFCKRLGPADIATSCHVAVGQEIAVLRANMTDREIACGHSTSEYLQSCRYGAGLTPDRPTALPLP